VSFSFTAVGKRDDVSAQLRHKHIQGVDSEIGREVAQLLARHIAKDDAARTGAGYDVAYTVRASGHSGGSAPLSLTLTVECNYVPAVETGAESGETGS
jgi:hypothetical protein